MRNFNNIGKNVRKIDSLSLATGAERFVDDFSIDNPLHIKLLYSPHAHAVIKSIDTSKAEATEGVALVLDYRNTPDALHTTAGQGFPEPSPYDTRIFDKKVRFVGDRVALVAAETEDIAEEAIAKIEVEYEILEPIFDPEHALDDDAPKLHGGDAYAPIPVEYDPSRNLAAKVEMSFGDLEKGFAESDMKFDITVRTQYASHCAIEPHGAFGVIDERGRMVIYTATQVPFHARRIVARTLDIPIRDIRVVKPRIGGGFGGKQEVFLEQLVGLVTWRTKRSSKIILTREEVFANARTRHPMRTRMRVGAKADGEITTIDLDCLMNTGAYGSHALTVLSNAGGKVLPLLNKVENVHFLGQSVYTNLPVGGAYRGYGATQSYFAYNQVIDMVARAANVDVLDFFKKWAIKTGETSEVFRVLGEGKEGVAQIIRSCGLEECIDKGAKAIGWSDKRGKHIRNGDKIKGVGVACAMQGSGIPKIDMGAASMKMNEDGSFNLYIGATDIGTGSDTIMAQIAGEVLGISPDKFIVLSSDTDLTPFDVGAYASSTTYISGEAVRKCAIEIAKQIKAVGAEMLDIPIEEAEIENGRVFLANTDKSVSYEEICYHAMYSHNQHQIAAYASHFADESPPPFFAQFAEVDVDIATGRIIPIKFISAVDCGQPLNPRLAEGQVEGAVVNGIAYALWEEYIFSSKGKMMNPRFWDYKIYNTRDLPEMVTILADSYEETGPFGAKSVGEIAINGPIPAIANAVFDAVGVRLFETPFTPERVYKRLREEGIIE
jgi:CO/xanthine dehydrogenase Mo-binding subunit